ncbi:MAG: D-2-hydroxyacid dehydrogenase [Eubacteriales bacterium]|nr:D-2-hydroxyacid dehydrogenase [Eubacteriales bacterium]
MYNILVLMKINEETKAAFREAAGDNKITFVNYGINDPVPAEVSELLKDADIVIGQPEAGALKAAENIKWLQSRFSGVDNYLAPGVLGDDVIITSATGAYGQSVAEHIFAMMLGIMKKLPFYRDNQMNSLWNDEGAGMSPEGKKVLIIGTGDLGSNFAVFCKAFGAHTIGVRRDPSKGAEGIDEMHGMDEIDELIKTADVVVTLLPHSEEMKGFFNYERFMSMKKDAIFINAGRGPIVDSDGLNRALSEGQLFGAALDTTAPEPLPADHPLWKQPRAIITPHVAGGDHIENTIIKVSNIAIRNLKAYLAGEPMINRKR